MNSVPENDAESPRKYCCCLSAVLLSGAAVIIIGTLIISAIGALVRTI